MPVKEMGGKIDLISLAAVCGNALLGVPTRFVDMSTNALPEEG